MEFDQLKDQLYDKIEICAERLEVNYIIGIPTGFDGISDAKFRVDEYLKSDSRNKIHIQSAIVVHNIYGNTELTQQYENQCIEKAVYELAEFILIEVEKFAKRGEFKYELNELFKELMEFADLKRDEMDFQKWVSENNRENIEPYYLLLGNEKLPYDFAQLELSPLSYQHILSGFNYRKQSWQHLKNVLVNVFSKYLFLPDLKVLPQMKYTCTMVDVCELIQAISESDKFGKNEMFKAMLLGMFNIDSNQFTSSVSKINHREKGRGQFLKKLYEVFDPKPKGKSEKLPNSK